MDTANTLPIIRLIYIGAEGRSGRYLVHCSSASWSGVLDEFQNQLDAQTYAASLYDGLGHPGYYRGVAAP